MKIKFNELSRIYKKHFFRFLLSFNSVMRKGNFILGNQVAKFEKNFSNYIGVNYCVGVNSGLDALIFALKVIGIKEGDEVIVPANTYIATVLAITQNMAKPIFVEPDNEYNIDPDKIEKCLTKKTKAIIVVHLYGQSAKMEKILELKQKYGLYLIEDCAQSHGAKYNGKFTGSFGDIGCFSFYPTKNIGTYGDGGCIVTNNLDFSQEIKLLRNYGSSKKYYNDIQGFNSRLDEIQASFLNIKLYLYNKLLSIRIKIANYYLQNIKNPFVQLPKTNPNSSHVYHLFVVKVTNREKFQRHLSLHNIDTLVHYPIPPHLSLAYKNLGYHVGDFPITEDQSNSVVSLPLYDYMTIKEAKYIVEKINSFKIDT